MRLFDEILVVNRRVELTWEGADRPRYQSRIEEVDTSTVTIAAPLQQRVPVYIRPGTRVQVEILYDGKRYAFVAPVIRAVPGRIPVLELEKPKELKVVNLRQFFRLDVTLDAKIAPAANSENPDAWVSCTVINLSGNGLLAAVDDDLWDTATKEVKVCLVLPGAEILELSGRVVRTEQVEGMAGLVNRIAVHFEEISNYAQDKIMKFLFEEQRRRRARGLL